MDIITETELLTRINAFLERHQMARTTFGRNATGEPQLIRSIENGRSPSLSLTSKVIDYMARLDDERATRDKLTAAFPLSSPPPEAEEIELPFVKAPVTLDTGASSPTSSPTSGRRSPSAASQPCPSSCDPEADAA